MRITGGKKRLLSAVVLFESHKFSAVETCHVQFISVIHLEF